VYVQAVRADGLSSEGFVPRRCANQGNERKSGSSERLCLHGPMGRLRMRNKIKKKGDMLFMTAVLQ
jgi:hypothetical protein